MARSMERVSLALVSSCDMIVDHHKWEPEKKKKKGRKARIQKMRKTWGRAWGRICGVLILIPAKQ